MVQQAVQNNDFELSQEQIQSLVATSTGFIESYIIPVHGDVAIILPQNIVLSALNVPSDVNAVEWHEKMLPTYHVHDPALNNVIALVVEGDDEQTRFAILCDQMPTAMRLRISEVQDDERVRSSLVYQYVKVGGIQYQIPNMHNIQKMLFNA